MVAKRDAQATRSRILLAARSEFAQAGIAGARVDRIAAAAQINKNMLYIYFGSKEQLFDAVFDVAIGELLETVGIDTDDLPEYAGRLFDHFTAHPELCRLARWFGLERPGGLANLEKTVAATVVKIDELAAAQARGTVTARVPPVLLLDMLLVLAATWSSGSPEQLPEPGNLDTIADRRKALVWAVSRLVAP